MQDIYFLEMLFNDNSNIESKEAKKGEI